MPRFTLIAEHLELDGSSTGETTTHEFTADFLPDVLERFELFLRGVGYNSTGVLDFVTDDFVTEDFETKGSDLTDIQHSEFWYDKDRNK